MTPSLLLEEIYNSALKFLQPMPLQDRYRLAVQEAIKLVNADHGSIFLEKNGELVRVYTNVPTFMKVKPRKHGNTYKTFVSGKLRIVAVDKKFNKIHPRLYQGGAKSLILIPLTFEKKSIGVLTLQSSEEKHFTDVKINTLNLFGSFVGLAVLNSQLYEKAQDALRTRDLFISLASHELKTPLTTIMAYGDLIAKKVGANEIPNPRSVEILRSEIRRLKNMLDEFLALDKIKTGELEYKLKRVNIIDIVKKAIINFKLNFPGYKVFVENNIIPESRIILADNEKLQQVFTNLLNNSAKFSSSLTPIVMSLTEDKDFIFISITDYGKGIRKKEQSKVFQEFFKESGNTKEGMGIGLYLVKSIIENHQGTISLTSKLHKGTIITIQFPKKKYATS